MRGSPDRVKPEPPPAQYRVLRSFKTGADTFAEPGTVITIDGSWPYHRASDLTRQRYLEPIAPTPVRRGT